MERTEGTLLHVHVGILQAIDCDGAAAAGASWNSLSQARWRGLSQGQEREKQRPS